MTDLTPEAVKAALDGHIEYQWDRNSPLEDMAPALARDWLRLKKVEAERRKIEDKIWVHVGEYLAGQLHSEISPAARRGIEFAIHAAFRAAVEGK